MSKSSRLYYDGECPLCQAFVDTVANDQAAPERITAQSLDVTAPAPLKILLRDIHLVEGSGLVRTGPDAILTTLSYSRPWLSPLTRLFRISGFRQIANFVYRMIANRRLFLFGMDQARIFWLFILTSVGLLSGIILTWPLWQSERTYPLTPLFDTTLVPGDILAILPITLALALFLGIFSSRHHAFFARIALVLVALLVILDITRLQPWVWHYAALLLLISFWRGAVSKQELLDAARFIVVGIYFWSGVQKFNTAFYLETFPWFTEALWSPLGTAGAYTMLSLGVFIPFIEATFALLLLTKRFRRLAIYAAFTMLILVTSAIMIGKGWNTSVWPWNFCLFGMVLALFWRHHDTFKDLLTRTKKNLFAQITIALFLIMPLGNVFGITDHYLSWSLYSGHVPTAHLTAPQTILQELAPHGDIIPHHDGSATVSFVDFSITTQNAVPYPEERVFLKIFQSLCQEYRGEAPLMFLTIETRPFFLSHNVTSTVYTCHEE